MIHRYRIFQFRPKTNVRHPKSPNVRPNTNVREGFVFARTFGHFTERLAISASKVLPRAVGQSQLMHFQCQNYQMFGKIAEHTAKTNILLITETQISMPNLHSDQCTAHVRPEPSARKPFRCITARHNFEVFCHSNIYKQTFPQARTLLDLMSLPRVSKTLITQPMQWMGTSTHSGRVSRTTKGPGSSLT